ncbi:phage tail protein [Xenorhabdus szentirmaii]|uniref:phage tail protein n=1 Tax=Xenorhabdus szentirmaii TaxID=290112 RepID=UPI0032B732B9
MSKFDNLLLGGEVIHMMVSLDISDVQSLIDWKPSLIATHRYVREKIKTHEESRDHTEATLKEKGFVVLNSDVGSNSESHAATSKAVKTVHDLANIVNKPTDKWVPSTRKINDKALSEDISLNAEDVDTYRKADIDSRIANIKELVDIADKNTTTAIKKANDNLSKIQNGADILDKNKFVENLVLKKTVELAQKALPQSSNAQAQVGSLTIDYGNYSPNIRFNTNYVTDNEDQSYYTEIDFGANPWGELSISARKPMGKGKNGANYLFFFPKLSAPYSFTPDAIFATLNDLMPIGIPMLMPTHVIKYRWDNYQICNGQPFDKTRYPIIAGMYPSGYLPDLSGYSISTPGSSFPQRIVFAMAMKMENYWIEKYHKYK